MGRPVGAGLDFRGSPRLTGSAERWWYLVGALSYIGFGIFHKVLLNWFVGPLWLVAVVAIGPALVDWRRRRRVARQ